MRLRVRLRGRGRVRGRVQLHAFCHRVRLLGERLHRPSAPLAVRPLLAPHVHLVCGGRREQSGHRKSRHSKARRSKARHSK